MSERNMRRYSQGKYWVADFRTEEWMFSHKYVVLVAARERHESLQKRLSRNEVAELSEAELIRLIHIQLGIPGSRSEDSRVHESDGSPHGVVLLLWSRKKSLLTSGEHVIFSLLHLSIASVCRHILYWFHASRNNAIHC